MHIIIYINYNKQSFTLSFYKSFVRFFCSKVLLMEFGNTWGNEKEYALYFFNDRLIKWGYLNDDWPQLDISDGDILGCAEFFV